MKEKLSRRSLIQSLCGGIGSVGLAGLLADQRADAATLGRYVGPKLPPKAKHVICLFMTGGPSQVDMFDPKPALVKYQGQRPSSADLRTERQTGGLLPSAFSFSKCGKSGVEVSELLPQLGSVIDEVCVIRSMYTFNPTHTPARSLFHTGSILSTRPSTGAWISYGLGTENENLPAFVVLGPGTSGGGGSLSRSAFLPAEHQGISFSSSEVEPEKMIPDLRNTWLDAKLQRRQMDAMQALNRSFSESFGADEYLEGRIKSMEAAYRMQFEAMDVFDIRKESEAIRQEYGNTPFANGCLLARRLVESGVRYIHVNYGAGQVWDDHKDIETNLRKRCPDMDQAAAALIRDLKRRGLLDSTLVVWGGEFGRTPVSESGTGRDHNAYGFTMWVAGGGVKGGLAYGATDEFGFKAVENRVSIHDLHATLLHQLGIDHTRLTYRYAGRDFRLTDVFGDVVKDILV
ncbi:MAG TPA: DUF1501 domain-containing protein [Bryobacteraceae bacterium]|nr:DUF1501 domain-containing protein [Bryobacteraceae bacterium]